MKQQAYKAVVLDYRDHGESDKIVTFYSDKLGKFTGIAKGAFRSKKRFVNKLEQLSYLTLTCSFKKGSDLAFIHDAELIDSFISIREQIPLYFSASLIREIMLTSTPFHQEDKDIFHLLLWALQTFEAKGVPHTVVVIFLTRLYNQLGYRPHLAGCHSCGIQLCQDRTYTFQHSLGGLICDRCTTNYQGSATPLSMGTIKLLSSAMDEPLHRLSRLRFTEHTAKQALHLLQRFGRTIFQRDAQSWKMVLQ